MAHAVEAAPTTEIRTPLATVTLRTKTPCCARRVRIVALVDVPHQKYDRTCAGCGRAWIVDRVEGRSFDRRVRIDVLTWEPCW
jgi:hypothetical protein